MLLTKEELAKELGISVASVLRHCDKGLPKINVGVSEQKRKLRFNLDKVMAWFEANEKLNAR